jgi:hypothetical protein
MTRSDPETRLILAATLAQLWPSDLAKQRLETAAGTLPLHPLAGAAKAWLARGGPRADPAMRHALAAATDRARGKPPSATVVRLHPWQHRADLQ